MTLAEKIAALRGERRLSQGELAERLDVSRQSVSKWETGQAVPELDKIVKLADLFGVTVDQLVRDGDLPGPEEPPADGGARSPGPGAPPAEGSEPRIVYVEPKGPAPVQKLGVVALVVGILLLFCGGASMYLPVFGVPLAVLSLPLILAKKHPWLIAGWLLCLGSCLVLNPYTSTSTWGLRDGLYLLYLCLTRPKMNYYANQIGAAVGIVRGTLALALIVSTARACWKRWKARSAAHT